jgi:hypothetical protein
MGVISNWWAKQHGRQLGIAATASGAIGILLFVAVYQLLFFKTTSLGAITPGKP